MGGAHRRFIGIFGLSVMGVESIIGGGGPRWMVRRSR